MNRRHRCLTSEDDLNEALWAREAAALARDPFDATLTAAVDLMRVLRQACEARGIPDSMYRQAAITVLDAIEIVKDEAPPWLLRD